MTGRENALDRVARAALVAFGLASLAAAAVLMARDDSEPGGPVAARVEALRGLLDHGEILGYLDDGDGGEAATEAYFRTQYALAPALIERGAVHPRVVGRFLRPPSAVWFRERGLVIERDFGQGVLLLRREGP